MFGKPLRCWFGFHAWSVRLMPTYPGCELQSRCLLCPKKGVPR